MSRYYRLPRSLGHLINGSSSPIGRSVAATFPLPPDCGWAIRGPSAGILRGVFRNLLSNELAATVIELAIIWALVYFTYQFLRGTRGAGVIKGIAVALVCIILLQLLGQATESFDRIDYIFDRFLTLLSVLLIVIFQPELRQAAIRLGQAHPFRSAQPEYDAIITAIDEAAALLSKNQCGALIAIERAVQLGGLIEGGQRIDALVSAPLLEAIFWPNSPLHDLGVVVRGDRIVAAKVQFPLVEEGVIPRRFGSRHRAAVGLSMELDCLVVIVSEETGAVSLAEGGRLEHDIPRKRFRALLSERLAAEPASITKASVTASGAVPPPASKTGAPS